jgi:hypothetical protein
MKLGAFLRRSGKHCVSTQRLLIGGKDASNVRFRPIADIRVEVGVTPLLGGR